VVYQHRRRTVRQVATLGFAGAAALGLGPAGAGAIAASSLPAPIPAVSDYQYMSGSTTPPAETDCFSVSRRCFTPASMQASYNLPPLYANNEEGQGMTIAIIDSFGNPNMASDLGNFDTQMGLRTCAGSRA
jgi:subtilase family serine protease